MLLTKEKTPKQKEQAYSNISVRSFVVVVAILLAFLLGFPANEIVVPSMLMGYLSTGALTEYGSLAQLQAILTANGWTVSTALCVLFLTLFHFPCGTTCLTIWRETKSVKWTALAIALPTAVGVGLCLVVTVLSGLFF